MKAVYTSLIALIAGFTVGCGNEFAFSTIESGLGTSKTSILLEEVVVSDEGGSSQSSTSEETTTSENTNESENVVTETPVNETVVEMPSETNESENETEPPVTVTENTTNETTTETTTTENTSENTTETTTTENQTEEVVEVVETVPPTIDEVYEAYGCGRTDDGQRKFLVCHQNHSKKVAEKSDIQLCLPEPALKAHVGVHHDRGGEKDYFGECGAGGQEL